MHAAFSQVKPLPTDTLKTAWSLLDHCGAAWICATPLISGLSKVEIEGSANHYTLSYDSMRDE